MTAFNDVKIVKDADRLTVGVPYNPQFARRARALGGVFDDSSKTWTFNPQVERLVKEALGKWFWWHEGVESEKRVAVTIDPYDYMYVYSGNDGRHVWFAGRDLVFRFQGDRPPRMASNTALVDGVWPKSDVLNDLNLRSGKLRLLVWDVPISFLERLKPGKFELSEPDDDTLTAVDERIRTAEERLARLRDLRTRLASTEEGDE